MLAASFSTDAAKRLANRVNAFAVTNCAYNADKRPADLTVKVQRRA